MRSNIPESSTKAPLNLKETEEYLKSRGFELTRYDIKEKHVQQQHPVPSGI